jgi:membrane-bound lytic murein transglycosylase MltF
MDGPLLHCLARHVGAALLALGLAGTVLAEESRTPAKPAQLRADTRPRVGDFDQMLQRRTIRVLVPPSRSLFFIDQGHELGLTAEDVRDFERHLNRKFARELAGRPLTVFLVPTTRDKLLKGVAEGRGDIAAGNLTITDERRKVVDFAPPQGGLKVRELVVTGPRAPALRTLDDLSGRTVHVRPATSYAESLAALNRRFAAQGKPPMTIAALPDALEDEDKLEMLNAGLLDIAVIDDWKGRLWAQVLPAVRLREDLVLRDEGRIAWGIRKHSPRLAAEIADFHTTYRRKHAVMEARVAKYFRRVQQIRNHASGAELKRFNEALALFGKYGGRYGFDPLMLAAQGYQESRLRQEARSARGAIGIMQVMPATGHEMNVGDIAAIEPNIHAGAKYMNQMVARYFPDARFGEADRTLFAFAAYNAGPGAIGKARREAARRGLDADQWFNNVEIVVAERLGLQTTTYVRNIYKYYVSYRMLAESRGALEARARQGAGAKEEQKPPGKAAR